MAEPILEIKGLAVELPPWADRPQAVSDTSLALARDEILCVVGESGSGKSVMARAVMRLLPEHLRASAGAILLEGEDLMRATPSRMREVRGSSRAQGLDRIAVMAALNIAHELLQARQNNESDSGALAQHLQAMRTKLDAALAPRLK